MFIYNIETILTGILLLIFIILKVCWAVSDWWKYRNCKHEKYRETSACDAICNNCNKNLGFIGNVRSRGKQK